MRTITLDTTLPWVLVGAAAAQMLPATKIPIVTVATEGSVLVNDHQDWRGPGRLPTRGQQDTLRTGWGRAEVHLGPGSGLWVGANSLVWMTLVKPSNSKFEILRGTAVLEIAKIEKRAKVTLSYQGAKVSVLEAGLYKVDTDPAGLSVFKGKALVSVGGRRVEIGVGETLSLNRALTKTSFELATNNGLDQWREWRARHGAPGLGVPFPGGGRIMPRGGSGALSLIPFGDPANRSPSGWTRFPAGGRSGGGVGGPQIARSTGGTVFVNDRPVNPSEEAPQRIKDGDTIRTTQGRVEISLTGRSSLWAGENSSVRIQQVWMFMARFELLGGTAVLEQDFENSSVTFVWQDATISILEPGLYRLDANPAVLRVFEGSAEVEVAGRKVEVLKGKMLSLDGSWALIKFNRGKTDSFGLWRARRSEQTRRTPYTL